MYKSFAAATFAAILATPVLAQVVETPSSTQMVVPPGSPGVVTRQGGATGSEGAANYSPSGRPADTISNDSSAAGNAGQPSQVAPQGGSNR